MTKKEFLINATLQYCLDASGVRMWSDSYDAIIECCGGETGSEESKSNPARCINTACDGYDVDDPDGFNCSWYVPEDITDCDKYTYVLHTKESP